MPYSSCLICGKEFYVKPNWLKLGWGKYCSRDCVFKSQRKGRWVRCFICKKQVWKAPRALIHSRSGRYFCNKSCQTLWRNQEFIGSKHGNWKTGEKSYRDILKRSKITPICERCKSDDVRILVVHHLDRDRKNNKVENLAWVCHNCHYLIHHNKKENKIFMEALV